MTEPELSRVNAELEDPEDPEFSLLVQEKQIAIRSIEELGYKVTPAALAEQSRLSIDQASFWLNKIAGETGGTLEVSGNGKISYSFAPDFKGVYIERGFRKLALTVGVFLFQLLYWAVRVSFGVALIASILIVICLIVLAICAAIAAMFSDSGGGDGGGDFGNVFEGFFNPEFMVDLFRWDFSPGITYYPNSSINERQQLYHDYNEAHPKGNFFLECFSFLFGDGAPNSDLQKIRWRRIARVIAQNRGVVSSEQLAPFLDGDGSDSGMIMSALAQFNGRPEVTESGFIVYVFPDFLEERPESAPQAWEKDPYLREDQWKFSAYPSSSWIFVLFLAFCNFAGSWWLFRHIATINLLHQVAALIDVLLAYSILFLLIPGIRALVLIVLNQRIEARNDRRKLAWEAIANPSIEVRKELAEAAEIREQQLAQINQKKSAIVYSSDKDLLEQEFENLDK